MTFGCTVFEGVIECLEEVSGCGEFECWFEGSKQCEGTLCGGCGPDLQYGLQLRVGGAELLLIEEGGGRADECVCVRFGVVFGGGGGFGQEQGPLERRTAGDCGG